MIRQHWDIGADVHTDVDVNGRSRAMVQFAAIRTWGDWTFAPEASIISYRRNHFFGHP